MKKLIEDKLQELEARIALLELARIEDRHIIDTSKPTRFKALNIATRATNEAFATWAIPVVDAGPINKVLKGNK